MTAHETEIVLPNAGAVSDIPQELRALRQWVGWRYIFRGDGKRTKFPVSPVTGRGADSTDSAHWGTLADALELLDRENCEGISFAFAPDDPYCGIDLDDVIDPDTGEADPDALAVVDRFASYAELSPSRTGIHIILRGSLADLVGRKRGDRECYDRARFFTMTGLRCTPHGVEERQSVLDAWHAETFPPAGKASAYTGPVRPLDLTDSELLGKIARSKQALKFGRLWAGNTDDYRSGSEADLALCGMLAFWCGRDPGAVDRLFRSSGLMRAKWDARRGQSTYGAQTVARAVASGASYDPYFRTPAASGTPALARPDAPADERLAALERACEQLARENRELAGAVVDLQDQLGRALYRVRN